MDFKKRLESNFSDYRNKGTFVDCTISFEDHDISVHKIILAKYSKYFLNEFVKSSQIPYVFKPVYNPQDMLEKVIDFFYNNTIDISYNNLIAILAISRFYQISILEKIVSSHVIEHTKKSTALGFCQKCVEYQIQDQAKYFVPTIANNWESYKKEEIYKNIDASILSLILSHERFQKVDQDSKLQIIDEFFELKPAEISNTEKEKLTNVINWSQNDAYKYLTRHECSWVHPRVARLLLRRIMQERRQSTKALFSELNESNLSENASRWFLFTRVLNIKQANPEPEDGKLIIPIINYLSNYGNFMEGFDAVTTGAITIDSTPPMSKDIKVNYALGSVEGQKFISIGSATSDPYLELNFGPDAKLFANSIAVKCSSESQIRKKLEKMNNRNLDTQYICPNPKQIKIFGHASSPYDADVLLYDGDFRDEIDLPQVNCGPLSRIKIVLNGNNTAGYKILRIFGIEILGNFVL